MILFQKIRDYRQEKYFCSSALPDSIHRYKMISLQMSLLSKIINFFQLWVIKRGIIDIKNMFEINFNRNKPIGKKLACLAKNLPSLASLPCLPCQRDFPGKCRPQLSVNLFFVDRLPRPLFWEKQG